MANICIACRRQNFEILAIKQTRTLTQSHGVNCPDIDLVCPGYFDFSTTNVKVYHQIKGPYGHFVVATYHITLKQ